MRSIALLLLAVVAATGAPAQIKFSDAENAIEAKMRTLRSVPDDRRGDVTHDLALQIRALPNTTGKVLLSEGLANLSTEGDFGHHNLQAVADTLAASLAAVPPADRHSDVMAPGYFELAQLEAYEHVRVNLVDPAFAAAQAQVRDNDRVRATADFTLTDLDGRTWTRSALKGKVVVVNFWATWCPPCRKEMPDMGALYEEYKDRGLVVLAITDEQSAVVRKYLAGHGVPYTVLLDPGRKVNDLFRVDGIPKTFIFDRHGHLAAQAMDMRTRPQFVRLLAEAGLR